MWVGSGVCCTSSHQDGHVGVCECGGVSERVAGSQEDPCVDQYAASRGKDLRWVTLQHPQHPVEELAASSLDDAVSANDSTDSCGTPCCSPFPSEDSSGMRVDARAVGDPSEGDPGAGYTAWGLDADSSSVVDRVLQAGENTSVSDHE